MNIEMYVHFVVKTGGNGGERLALLIINVFYLIFSPELPGGAKRMSSR